MRAKGFVILLLGACGGACGSRETTSTTTTTTTVTADGSGAGSAAVADATADANKIVPGQPAPLDEKMAQPYFTTGGGIYYGLLSGTIAADVLHDALVRDRLGKSALRRYETFWRRRLGQEIRVGLAFRRIAANLSDDSIDALIDLARVNGIVPLLQETASFNWHRKAAIALLGHPSFRKIVFKSWARSSELL